MVTRRRDYQADHAGHDRKKIFYSFLCAVLCCFLAAGSVWAEVTLDGTLGRSGAVAGPNYRITADLGRQVGANLFHSFGKFNVYQAESAAFSGPASIGNIIGRITGGASSWIDGRLSSEIAGANLFLINPSGIMFGPNASLDISGSFHATTADYLKLGQDGFFYATNPEQSILTSAPPAAFGFLSSNPQGITSDHTMLAVPSGKTISIIGGNISLQNSTLFAQGGKINLASAASAGEISPVDRDLIVEGSMIQGNIIVSRDTSFTNHADIDARSEENGQDGGAVYIRGGRFELQGGAIDARTLGIGNSKGGGVNIRVTNEVIMDSLGIESGGAISTQSTNYYNAADAGDVLIEARSLSVRNGGLIITSTSGSGRGGKIDITAFESVNIAGLSSGLYSETYYGGEGGSISVVSPVIAVTDQGRILSQTAGSGRGGSINLTARDSVNIVGTNSGLYTRTYDSGDGGIISVSSSALTMDNHAHLRSDVYGSGKGGDINLNVDKLNISGGARIAAHTNGSGQGGNMEITADSVGITGDESGLLTATYLNGDGKSGDINITSGVITITDQGSIESFTVGDADAGDINLNAAKLNLSTAAEVSTTTFGDGQAGSINITAADSLSITGDGSRLFANTYMESGGKGGNISVTSPTLTIADQGQIQSVTHGDGDAGDIRLHIGKIVLGSASQVDTSTFAYGRAGKISVTAAESINIDGNYSGFYAGSYDDLGGDCGNIYVSSPLLAMANDARISSATSGTGNAGSIGLEVGKLDIKSGAQVVASTLGRGRGGNINITATESVSITGVGSSDVASGFVADTYWSANGGSITITAPLISVSDFGKITATTDWAGKAGDIRLNVNKLLVSGSSEISTRTYSSGQGGNIYITASELVDVRGEPDSWYRTGLFASSDWGSGAGGSIFVSTPVFLLSDSGYIEADGNYGNGGDITLNVGALSITGSAEISASTYGQARGGSINITASDSINIGNPFSGLYVNSYGSGNAGSITLTSPLLEMRDTGVIFALAAKEGNAGNIRLHIDKLTVDSGSLIAADNYKSGHGGNIDIVATGIVTLTGLGQGTEYRTGIFTTAHGDGDGGNVYLRAGALTVSNLGQIQAGTLGKGNSGNIRIDTGNLTLSTTGEISAVTYGSGNGGTILLQMDNLRMDNASISAKSSDTGTGGNITLYADNSIRLSGGSTITTETLMSDGGNIEIRAPQLVSLLESAVTTSVQGGLGNGGNISIDPQFITLIASSVIANAYGGNGGNIGMVSNYFLASPLSIVQASSQLGISGTVNITAPDIDLSGSLTVLPAQYLDASALLRDRCAALSDEKASSLVIAGRGGMPTEPDDFLPSP
jgi:filamentous hemagglutinin family protein